MEVPFGPGCSVNRVASPVTIRGRVVVLVSVAGVEDGGGSVVVRLDELEQLV